MGEAIESSADRPIGDGGANFAGGTGGGGSVGGGIRAAAVFAAFREAANEAFIISESAEDALGSITASRSRTTARPRESLSVNAPKLTMNTWPSGRVHSPLTSRQATSGTCICAVRFVGLPSPRGTTVSVVPTVWNATNRQSRRSRSRTTDLPSGRATISAWKPSRTWSTSGWNARADASFTGPSATRWTSAT